jgi:hypothetical protein
MTHAQVIDRIIGNAQASITTDETRFNRGFVDAHLSAARAYAIGERWKNLRSIHPLWLQPYDLDYKVEMQVDTANTCITKYACPAWISLDGKTDGMVFAGSTANKPFRIFNSIAELSVYVNMPAQSPYTGRFVGVVRTPGHIELHHDGRVTSGRMLMLYDNPLDCPTYNVEIDQYPVTVDLLNLIDDYLWKKFASLSGQPVDLVSNKNDVRVAQAKPYNQQN